MYWPLGAPKIYAATKRTRKQQEVCNEEEADTEGESKEDTAILGLQVARNGHLFATITDTTLTIWQSSVRSVSHIDTCF